MEFLLGFQNYNSPLLEHYYDVVINKQLGFPVSKNFSLKKFTDYIKQMIAENQVKDIVKTGDSINFTIKERKYTINKAGILTLYKIKSKDIEVKNFDVLMWIFGNKNEATEAFNTLYSGRLRTINKFEIEKLKELNNKIGKRSEEEFNKEFKSAKKSKKEEIKIDVVLELEESQNLYELINIIHSNFLPKNIK